MVVSCSAYGCTNRHAPEKNISFHTFPLKDTDLLGKWLHAIKRKNFVPTKYSTLCSTHFREEDFLLRPGKSKPRLSKNAVPSIFPQLPQYYQTKAKKPRNVRATSTALVENEEESALASSVRNEEESTSLPTEEKGSQTIDNSSGLVKTLRVKIKRLQQKLRRRSQRINTLKQLVSVLKKRGMLNSDLEYLIMDKFQGLTSELFLNVNKNALRSSKGQRYSDDLKKFAVTLYYYSPKSYKYCRSILKLPHPSSVRNWISNLECEPGFLEHVFKKLSTFPGKDCNLVIDSMAIRKQIIWDSAEQKYVGFSDIGNIQVEDNVPATEALVFMLVSIKDYWKIPCGYFLINKITANLQKNLIKTAIQMANASGVKIHSVTFDGAATNIATFQSLGCNIYGDLGKINSSFKINDQIIHAIPDACHMLKLARNCLAELKELKTEHGSIKWSYIDELHEVQNSLGLSFANKISSKHVQWYMNKMKVKLAAQTLSSSVATAIDFLEQSGVPAFEGAQETVKFISCVDKIFDFLNSKDPFLKGSKTPLTRENLKDCEKDILESISYLFSLSTLDGTPLFQSKRKLFVIGFAMAVKSVIAVANNVLKNPGFNYVLTYKFSQDYLELFFSKMRQRHGYNNNPNVKQFKCALRQILMKNEISPSLSANASLMQNDPTDNLFEIQWRKNKKFPSLMTGDDTDGCRNEPNDDREDDYVIELLKTDNLLQDNIIYYIGGFIIKKVLHKINCCRCRQSLIVNVINEHDYVSIGEFANFTTLKNRGGLVRVSRDVFNVLKVCNSYFMIEVQDFNNLSTIGKELLGRVINKTKNSLADDKLFSSCTDFSQLKSHKLEIISLICNEYLKIRLFAIGKIRTEKCNTVSKRHMYNKLVLFRNQ